MIFCDESELTTLGAVSVGHVVSYYGYGAKGEIALVLPGADGAKQLLVLPSARRMTTLNATETVLDLGEPRIAFDLASALASDDRAVPGTLLILPSGPGVFWAHPDFGALSVTIPLTGGTMTEGARSYETPAFNRWTVGIMRSKNYVVLAEIDAAKLNATEGGPNYG